MLEKLHRRAGTAGLAVAIVALVAATAGGAYAASGALTGKQKKEVKGIAKQFAGQNGAAGPAGPAGVPGAKGDAGARGETGAGGTPGKSVVLAAAGSECAAGGTKIEVEGSGSSRAVCNGKDASSSGTLASGQLETGVWSFTGGEEDAIGIPVPISFNIPLAAALEAEQTVYVPSGEPNPDPTDCPGNPNEPEAVSGFLCIYAGFTEGVDAPTILEPGSSPGASPAGALLLFGKPSKDGAVGFGSWAVTG
jgi:hypothetical protein